MLVLVVVMVIAISTVMANFMVTVTWCWRLHCSVGNSAGWQMYYDTGCAYRSHYGDVCCNDAM